MIKIVIFKSKDIWNKFLDKKNYFSFLQDYEYGETEKELGREIVRLGILNENKLTGICQLIGYKGKKANGLVVHHGPVIKEDFFKEGVKLILDFLKKNSFSKKYDFLRINPINTNENLISTFLSLGFRLAPTYAVTENFWIKKITDDKKMLNEMNESHRKKILESLKKPFLEIEKTNNPEKIDIFWEIYQNLTERKKFIPYSKSLIKKEFEIFSQANKALLFLGKVEGKYYSAALIIFSHKTAFYHHSASLPIKEPLNYKMQWEIIREAKERGCQFYNFWGIARKDSPEHPWYGLSQFKKGFGGKLIKLLPTFDYQFSWKYYLSYIYEKIKRAKL
jgi:lipid II:glycine glycyltransferase (peptidoglycan interpeptide bridge formation enzyme)